MKFISLRKNKNEQQNVPVENGQMSQNNQYMEQGMYNQGQFNNGYDQNNYMNNQYPNNQFQGSNMVEMPNNVAQSNMVNMQQPMVNQPVMQEQPMYDNQPMMQEQPMAPMMQEQPMYDSQPMVQEQPIVEQPEEVPQVEVPIEEQVNMEAINNMANISMESQEVKEEPKEEIVEEPLEELEVKLDPLNNANNPIPVNPVAVDVVVDDSDAEKAKTGFFVNVGMCMGLLFKPAKTIVENTKKYRVTKKAFSVYLWMVVLSLLLCIASRLVLGCFVKTVSLATGRYVINFDMGRMFMLDNYTWWLVATIVVSGIFVLLVALVYYACSFMNSKGISFGTYLMLATLGGVPITVGLLVLLPIGALFSSYFGLILFFIGFLYGYLIFLVGVLNTLNFKDVDSLLKYNLVNMLILGIVLGIILVVVVRYTSYDISYLISVAGLG